MSDCAPRLLPWVPDLRLWLPLLMCLLLGIGVLLALGGWIALYRLERRTARMLRSRSDLRAERVPALSATRRVQDTAFEARLRLVLAGRPRWWHRFTRRAS